MALSSCLGFPRIGPKRELKWALEKYWKKSIDDDELQRRYDDIRIRRWSAQSTLSQVPIFDCSLYDHVLDTVQLFSAIPQRFQTLPSNTREQYFAMARGTTIAKKEIPAMDMSKWFDTNYHYIVPEFESNQQFSLQPEHLLQELDLATSLGIPFRPVVLGPLSFLLLGKSQASQPFTYLDALLEAYGSLLQLLSSCNVEWLQLDEPMLAILPESESMHYAMHTYEVLNKQSTYTKILLATYFESLHDKKNLIYELPVEGIHVDCINGIHTASTLAHCAERKELVSLGVVDGRNIWRNDLEESLAILEPMQDILGHEKIMVNSSCSLLHCPIDIRLESSISKNILPQMSFAVQKIKEIVLLTTAITTGRESIIHELSHNEHIRKERLSIPGIHSPDVQSRLDAIKQKDFVRNNPFEKRSEIQKESVQLPLFPTTTIGSFPQTDDLRIARAQYKKQEITQGEYTETLRKNIAEVIKFQDEIDLDVLVHGEAERNDMVEYFGELLEGCITTEFGWVQSYGSRCVKPPIIYGDVYRKKEMTVPWISWAQSLTTRPVKGMLTGPVTILKWSFIRQDISKKTIAYQIALAIRDEVSDLEKSGISIIQIDEPALREGLPLIPEKQADYLNWAVNSFKLSSSHVKDSTQIHSHMCYSEFNDIIDSIIALDADVISIESTRSNMELLDTFIQKKYPYAIGPGVYDIHSPVIPSSDTIYSSLNYILTVINSSQVWVNPDCGLKTRKWEEITPSLANMVAAAKKLRQNIVQ